MRNNIIAACIFLSSAAVAAVQSGPTEELYGDSTLSEALCEPIGGGDLWHCLILDRRRFSSDVDFSSAKDPVPYAHLDISRSLNFRHDLSMLFIEAVTTPEVEMWLNKEK